VRAYHCGPPTSAAIGTLGDGRFHLGFEVGVDVSASALVNRDRRAPVLKENVEKANPELA
jgi:hypothetical protein